MLTAEGQQYTEQNLSYLKAKNVLTIFILKQSFMRLISITSVVRKQAFMKVY